MRSSLLTQRVLYSYDFPVTSTRSISSVGCSLKTHLRSMIMVLIPPLMSSTWAVAVVTGQPMQRVSGRRHVSLHSTLSI